MPDEWRLPPQWRTYRLVKLTGWTPAEIDAAPAVDCDWLLAIDDLIGQVRGKGEPTRTS